MVGRVFQITECHRCHLSVEHVGAEEMEVPVAADRQETEETEELLLHY